MRLTILRSACAAILLAGCLAGPVLGAPPLHEAAPAPDFDLPDTCAFPLLLHAIVNDEYATTFFDRDGNPTRLQVHGGLVIEVTRTDTGDSVVVNASGPGLIDLVTGDFIAFGPFLQWGPDIDGLVLFRGRHDPSGNGSGSSVNVCDMLAD